MSLRQVAVETARVPGCAVEHVYEAVLPHRSRVGVLFVTAASPEAAGYGVLLAVRGLLRRTEDHDQVLLRAPGPSEPALCHGIVTMPADAPLREMPVG
ncbi:MULTISPECIES: hypothetical protein [Streptomyces]|uniref:Uncharacterized protein n=1 Tax=Streptomyces alfalfae TaxID=1642299 RepID=A0A7T4TVS0_9ACTN|nr:MULTISPECIES: hypothetical protein [Streptomyces]QQC87364.1 hypothetical protein I8755_02275 [Streptomyces alfalfae]THC54938.1 hypothetical protein E7X58_00995 [Streptomyces sp. A1499]